MNTHSLQKIKGELLTPNLANNQLIRIQVVEEGFLFCKSIFQTTDINKTRTI